MELLEITAVGEESAAQSREIATPMGPMGNALSFLRAGGTVGELRDILALQREFEAGEAKKAYVAAMAEFKKNPPTIQKDKRVHFESKDGKSATDYWHATLGNVADAIIEGLAKVGVSHSWRPERKGDRIHVTCTLTHKMGHSESIELDGPLDTSGNKNNIQQMSSTTTYLSRYTLLMITGLAVKDEIMPDDDGGSGAVTPEDAASARLQEWTDKANAAINVLALNETRKMAGIEFNAAKDVVGWNAFKAIVEGKRQALTSEAAQ